MSQDITMLLSAIAAGDERAHAELLPKVYDELRRLAAAYMRRERPGHTLQATALVNEAYLKMAGVEGSPRDRTHFFALAAQSMRRVLVDHARARQSAKRGGDRLQVTLEESALALGDSSDELVALDLALARFAQLDPRGAQAVELMFFAGLTYAEAAEVLGVSKTTIFEDMKIAKAWLAKELS